LSGRWNMGCGKLGIGLWIKPRVFNRLLPCQPCHMCYMVNVDTGLIQFDVHCGCVPARPRLERRSLVVWVSHLSPPVVLLLASMRRHEMPSQSFHPAPKTPSCPLHLVRHRVLILRLQLPANDSSKM